MSVLLKISAAIDALTAKIAYAATWMVLLACVISAANALMRWGFSMSSNAWLEIQWYLFSALVMLGGAHTLSINGHVRVDAFYSRYRERTKIWIDLIGTILFLLPMCAVIGWLSWTLFMNSYSIGEVSGNAGGLIRWPVKILIPLGFLLLALQGVSEIIKRIANLTGHLPPAAQYHRPLQ